MTYNAKTDWKHDDPVTEEAFNRIESGVEDAHKKLATKAEKKYVDDRVKTPVPINADFKDTKYTAGMNIAIDEFNKISVTGQLGLTEEEVKKVKVNAAKDADTVAGHTVAKNVPADANFNDTIVDISGKVDKVAGKGLSQNDYTNADKNKVGDTATSISNHKDDKTNPHNVTKGQVGLGNVTNVKQTSEADFNAHTQKKATQTELGHIKLSDIPKPNIASMEDLRLNSKSELEFNNGKEWVPTDWLDVDDKTNSPGPKILVGGDMQAGYFGVVPAGELFTGTEIASALGITQGTAQFDDTGWLKFAIDGKIIYKSQKPFRYGISWDHIDSKGAVDGTKTVTRGGTTFKARLMKGALTDPSENNNSDRGAKGSEWNRLMLPVSAKAKDKSWAYPAYVEDDVPYWGIDFTDADLHTHNSHGNGTYQWCQEVAKSNASDRVYRGCLGVSYSFWDTSSNTSAPFGWSPVLEVVS